MRCLIMVAFVGVVLTTPSTINACTTAVISGRATTDGRPMLWKNRDSSQRENEVAIIDDGHYRVIGIVNAGKRDAVLIGTNSAGFCIQNSLSRDLLLSEKERKLLRNGAFMKRALQTCATVEDFRDLLEQTNGSRHTAANFGTIDAHGGAAMFEARSTSFVMFDANDPKVAPHGYIVRSNFSATANDLGPMPDPTTAGHLDAYGRFSHTCRRLAPLHDVGVGVRDVIRNLTRDMSDKDGRAYPGTVNGVTGSLPETIDTRHTVSRSSTVSAGIIHGVKPGEDPGLTTLWVMLGDPKFTIAVPCWVSLDDVADPLKYKTEDGVCAVAMRFREDSLGGNRHTISTSTLPTIWTSIWPMENRLLEQTHASLEKWRLTEPSSFELQSVHREAAEQASQTMRQAREHLKHDN